MKKRIFIFFLAAITVSSIFLPAQGRTVKENTGTNLIKTETVKTALQVRYVRYRGRLYRIRYRRRRVRRVHYYYYRPRRRHYRYYRY